MYTSDGEDEIHVRPAGGWRSTTPLERVTAYAPEPAFTGIEPGSATVVVEPEPDADRCPPNAWEYTGSAPLHAEIRIPPSVTEVERFARTARIESPPGAEYASGKFCTFVATYEIGRASCRERV